MIDAGPRGCLMLLWLIPAKFGSAEHVDDADTMRYLRSLDTSAR